MSVEAKQIYSHNHSKLPEAINSGRDTTTGSINIVAGHTPEFLQELNIGQKALDELLPPNGRNSTSKMEQSNKDLKGTLMMMVPDIRQPNQN